MLLTNFSEFLLENKENIFQNGQTPRKKIRHMYLHRQARNAKHVLKLISNTIARWRQGLAGRVRKLRGMVERF